LLQNRRMFSSHTLIPLVAIAILATAMATPPGALVLALAVSIIEVALISSVMLGGFTLASGRTNVMHGAVHLVIFAAFLFLALVP